MALLVPLAFRLEGMSKFRQTGWMINNRQEIKFPEIKDSIIWLNRALNCYLAARELWFCNYSGHYRVILFLGFQSVESVLKAALLYWDKSFKPRNYGHNTKKMFCRYQEMVPEKSRLVDQLECYFGDYKRYQVLPRYPLEDLSLLHVNPSYLDPLDYAFCGFAYALPKTRWGTQLDYVMSGKDPSRLEVFEKENQQIGKVRKRLGF